MTSTHTLAPLALEQPLYPQLRAHCPCCDLAVSLLTADPRPEEFFTLVALLLHHLADQLSRPERMTAMRTAAKFLTS